MKVTVLDPTTLDNKLLLRGSTRQYASIASDFYTRSLLWYILNDSPAAKHNQYMEYVVGSGYQVIHMGFPITPPTSTKPTSIEYATSSGTTGIALDSQIMT
jgi:hypothetical protein